MKPETDGVNYDYAIHAIWMVGAFWTTQEMIMTSSSPIQRPDNMVEMSWYMLLPYLTEKGREEYLQINEYLQKQLF